MRILGYVLIGLLHRSLIRPYPAGDPLTNDVILTHANLDIRMSLFPATFSNHLLDPTVSFLLSPLGILRTLLVIHMFTYHNSCASRNRLAPSRTRGSGIANHTLEKLTLATTTKHHAYRERNIPFESLSNHQTCRRL